MTEQTLQPLRNEIRSFFECEGLNKSIKPISIYHQSSATYDSMSLFSFESKVNDTEPTKAKLKINDVTFQIAMSNRLNLSMTEQSSLMKQNSLLFPMTIKIDNILSCQFASKK